MKSLVVLLYAQVIKFVQRAASWYGECKLKHMLTAITRPYSLRFQDLVDSIAETATRIDRLALVMTMAELREARIELQEVRLEQQTTHKVAVETKQALEG